ncbi:MAG: hypothetical protein H6Q68_929 [Firmicutes bacterium]|nr:hypothetical protein [Bacillota bacterium]
MKSFKKQFWGYRQTDVDKYLDNLHKEHQILMSTKKVKLSDVITKKNKIMSEIAHAEQILKKYRDEERQSFDLLAVELASAKHIVREAEEKGQTIKRAALNNLQAQEERLFYLQELMQQVYGKIADVMTNLREINDGQEEINVAAGYYSTGLRVIKRYGSERKTVSNTCSAGVRGVG